MHWNDTAVCFYASANLPPFLGLLNALLAVLDNLCSKLSAKTMKIACANPGVVAKFIYLSNYEYEYSHDKGYLY